MADPALIRYLQWLVERASAGEIDGVAIVTTQPNSEDAKIGDTSWHGSGIERKASEVIGNLEILKSRIVEAERTGFGSRLVTQTAAAA